MEKAYMIRNDGKRFPCVQHYYGNLDDVFETLYAGEWLYKHTQFKDQKDQVIDLVASYGKDTESLTDKTTFIDDLCAVIKKYPFKYLSQEFVKEHADEILKSFDKELSSQEILIKRVVESLNQEFLRARYGGLYNTNSSSREMVFRVSSTGFNWYNIIWEFVYDNKRAIDAVTIVRDEEATGVPNYFYHVKDGSNYDRYPVDDFINESGNPVIEKETMDPLLKYLREGKPLCNMYMVHMNKERIDYRFKCITMEENICRNFW